MTAGCTVSFSGAGQPSECCRCPSRSSGLDCGSGDVTMCLCSDLFEASVKDGAPSGSDPLLSFSFGGAGACLILSNFGGMVILAILSLSVDRIKQDRKSTRLNSSHTVISYAVFCLKKK